ncbi:hypothetical protein PVK06_002508 [Gossypium arboreum]|uniref:Reverse transcriptase domain-containing protein n=1 Tax=Gossypium arboreum TaxID=29729 RepID=A0ABR0R527_GOSAR|nr:hypothetical protein PVK06_002508 [Gossypium arboreum]
MEWARKIKLNRGKEVERFNRRLEELNHDDRSEGNLAELVEVKLHLNMEIDKEERYASQRRRNNRICELQRGDGSLATGGKDMENIARAYFLDLFESKGVGNLEHILSRVQTCISDGMNQRLMAPSTKEEIVGALKGMGPTKASGPDGFPVVFYQKYWDIIGKNTMANRLKDVLDDCIDATQSAFIPGRLITENVLLAYELLHSFKNKRTDKKDFMALKLDMRKAYDRVEWIGDGQKVSIWEDTWVPRLEEARIQNLNPNSGLIKVAELIDTSTFMEKEAESILCIPLSLNSHKDQTVWRGEPTGEYSVRSGYKYLLHEEDAIRERKRESTCSETALLQRKYGRN